MTKEDVIEARKLYENKPFIVVLDNEHNFMDNYPGRCFPIWDDDKELVTFIETNQISGGMQSDDFPYTVVVTPYACIQSIRIMYTRANLIEYLQSIKGILGEEKYKYNLSIISKGFRNTRPNPGKPYYDKLKDNVESYKETEETP